MKRYRSAFGTGLVFLAIPLAASSLGMLNSWFSQRWLLFALSAIPVGVGAWMIGQARYMIEEAALDIRIGFFHRNVPWRDIKAVHRRTLPKGAMLGFGSDFIGIEYGEKTVNVSPKDADGFVEAVRERMEDAHTQSA